MTAKTGLHYVLYYVCDRGAILDLADCYVFLLLRVTEDSVYNWEMNRHKPVVQLIPRIIHFFGYAPYDSSWSFGQANSHRF